MRKKSIIDIAKPRTLVVEVKRVARRPRVITAIVRHVDKAAHYFPPGALNADPLILGAAEVRCLVEMRKFKARWKNLKFARGVVAEIAAAEQSAGLCANASMSPTRL